MTSPVANLSGLFFIALTDDNEPEWQGQITTALQTGYHLCQLFDWMGSPSSSVTRHLSQMNNWRFYDDGDDWREAFRKFSKAWR